MRVRVPPRLLTYDDLALAACSWVCQLCVTLEEVSLSGPVMTSRVVSQLPYSWTAQAQHRLRQPPLYDVGMKGDGGQSFPIEFP